MNQFAMKGCLEKQPIKKGQIYQVYPFLIVLCPKSLSKTMKSTGFFGKSYIFGCIKPFSLAICEKCMVKTLILHLCP
jgi:hypothetical protein